MHLGSQGIEVNEGQDARDLLGRRERERDIRVTGEGRGEREGGDGDMDGAGEREGGDGDMDRAGEGVGRGKEEA